MDSRDYASLTHEALASLSNQLTPEGLETSQRGMSSITSVIGKCEYINVVFKFFLFMYLAKTWC